jgi:hypothetical protein
MVRTAMVAVARKAGWSYRFRRRVMAGLSPAQVCTYAIWDSGDHVKLGTTEGSPWVRLRALQTGCPSKLVMLAYTGSTSEREMHRRHATSRVRGEWYSASFKLLSDLVEFHWCDEAAVNEIITKLSGHG